MTRGSAVGLSVLAAVLGAVQLMVIGLVALVASGGGNGFDGGGFGRDADLSADRDACAGGDMVACDDLYFGSPAGSDEEAFAETCGERNVPAPGQCELTHGAVFDPADPGVVGMAGYGDDPDLDLLWDQCADGLLLACDDLYHQSPIGSDYGAFGSSCGGSGADVDPGFCFEGARR